MSAKTTHLSFESLLDYWMRDTDAATTETIDEHLMHCDACGIALDELIELGQGVRDAFRGGRIATAISASFMARLKQQGLKIREYHLAHNGSVNCAVAPDDDLLVARIELPLAGVQRVDAVAILSFAPDVEYGMQDIPFDANADCIYFAPRIAEIKQQPPHDMTLVLRSHEEGGGRELGRYVFHHGAWPIS